MNSLSQQIVPSPPTVQAPAATPEEHPRMSLFATCKATEPSGEFTLAEFVQGVREGRWRDEVAECRAILTKDGVTAYKASRGTVPALTLSGRFKTRRRDASPEERGAVHSGFLQLDFDAKDHPSMTVKEIREIVQDAPFAAACFLSISGDGVKGIARIPSNIDTHAGSWKAARLYFTERGLTLDPSTKDYTRLCFVSRDAQAFFNPDAEELEPVPMPEKGEHGESSEGTVSKKFAREILEQIAQRYARPEYGKWMKITSAVCDGVGEETAIELMKEYFPEEDDGEYEKLVHSLNDYISWDTLRSYGVNTTDPENLIRLLPNPDGSADENHTGKQSRKLPLRERAYALRFDPSEAPPLDETCMTIGDFPIAARGNVTVIQGKSKVGKSAVVSALLGSCQTGHSSNQEESLSLCISWKGDSTGAVIHIDTEQSPADWHGLVSRSVTRSGLAAVSPRLVSLPLVMFARSERLEILRQTLDYEKSEQGGIDAVLIDGIADICKSPNDEEEALDLVSVILALSHEYNAPVFCVLHENPSTGDGKTRGHLGSELNRKAFANLRIDKNAETLVSTIYGTDMRKRDIPKQRGFCFAWNEAERMHTFQGMAAGLKATQQTDKMTEKVRTEWEAIFGFAAEIGTKDKCPGMTPEEAAEVIRDMPGTKKTVKSGTMKKRMQRAEALGVLGKIGVGVWALNPSGQSGQIQDNL